MSGRRRRWPWLVLALLVAVVALIAWFPARWAWPLAVARYPALKASGVEGSVWDGTARGVATDDLTLGTVDWRLSRMALFGRLRLQVDVDGPALSGHARVRRDDDGTLAGENLVFRLDAGWLPPSPWTGGLPPHGTITGRLARWRLRQGWPVALEGTVRWNEATLGEAASRARLGTLQADLSDVAGTSLKARLHDVGHGPLALDGTFDGTLLGWRLHARLTPRTDDRRLRAALARMAPPAADGSIQLQRQMGLMIGGDSE